MNDDQTTTPPHAERQTVVGEHLTAPAPTGSATGSADYALIAGRSYPLKFEGYDLRTYKHMEGCPAFKGERHICCCGAKDRAAKIYSVTVPPPNPELTGAVRSNG